jgi:trk system potassium uptake protein TrkH
MLRDRKSVEYKDRRIPQRIVKEAIAIVTISFMIIVVFSILLSITENFSMKEVVYETISAFATVGLSLGITAELSFLGKILVTLLMYIGRVGPLTVAFALGQNSDVEEYTLMKGNIVVG